VHEGVEVEGGVEGVGEALEEVDLQGLDADVGGAVCGGGVGRGAVVALEVGVGILLGLGEVAACCGGAFRFLGGGH
jgi:hypothetical protein